MGAMMRRIPQVGENNFPLPWIPQTSSSPFGDIRSQTAVDRMIPTAMPLGNSGGTPLLDSTSPRPTAITTNPGPPVVSGATSAEISSDHGPSTTTLALAVTVPIGVAVVLGIIAIVVLNKWRSPTRSRTNSNASSKPIWREKLGLLRSSNSSTASSRSSSSSSFISGPISTALHNHPYYESQPRPFSGEQEQQPVEESPPQTLATTPGVVIFETPPPPYIQEPAPELPNLPAGLARLSYQLPPSRRAARPASELRISVQMANALRISARSIGFPRNLLPVSENAPSHPPLPEDLGRWSYPHNHPYHQQQQRPQSVPALPPSPDTEELRHSTLARFPVPPAIPTSTEFRPYTPTTQSLTVPQMQKLQQYRNTSPDIATPASPESPIWGHAFSDYQSIRPSHSVRSFTSTLYSDTASVHSARATMGMSARPTPIMTQGQGFFGDAQRCASSAR